MNKTDLIKELARHMGVPVVEVKLPTHLWADDAVGLAETNEDWKAKYDELMCDLTDTAISLNDKCAEIDKLRTELAEKVEHYERDLRILADTVKAANHMLVEKNRDLDAKDEKIEDLQCEVREYLQQERPRIMTQNDELTAIVIDALRKDARMWDDAKDNPSDQQKLAMYYTITRMLEEYATANDMWTTIKGGM